MRLLRTTAIVLMLMTGSASAEFSPVSPRIPDPAKFCDDLFGGLAGSPFNAEQLGKKIATGLGRPEKASESANAMKVFDAKRVDFAKKVIDKEINGALRQIIYYVTIDDVGFVYFRMNFKMTGSGWMFAHFLYRSDTNEIFPKDFVLEH